MQARFEVTEEVELCAEKIELGRHKGKQSLLGKKEENFLDLPMTQRRCVLLKDENIFGRNFSHVQGQEDNEHFWELRLCAKAFVQL